MKETNIFIEAVKRVRQQDKLAMNFLYTKYVKEMLTLAFRIMNDLAEAEDVVQESFLISFQKIEQLKEAKNYSYWLKRIVTNKSLNKIKNKIHFKAIEDVDFEEEVAEPRWYEQIKFETINQAIQTLPNGCRQILTLYLLDGYKHKEIAELFDISISTSKSQYQYALKLLRIELKDSYILGKG